MRYHVPESWPSGVIFVIAIPRHGGPSTAQPEFVEGRLRELSWSSAVEAKVLPKQMFPGHPIEISGESFRGEGQDEEGEAAEDDALPLSPLSPLGPACCGGRSSPDFPQHSPQPDRDDEAKADAGMEDVAFALNSIFSMKGQRRGSKHERWRK